MKMKTTWLAFVLTAVASSMGGPAFAEVAFEVLGPGSAHDMSADGQTIVGLTTDYETFRWTSATGVVPLGQNSNYIGRGAGTPDISRDGTRISASILSADSTLVVPGLWVEGEGWTYLMPPSPPDAGVIDQSLGSAWGLSGDGNVVTGLYQIDGAAIGSSAHGFRWEESTGVVSMVPESSPSSRINEADLDGNVLGGWSADPVSGVWRPTVWVDGVQTVLDSSAGASTWVDGINDSGTVLFGNFYDPVAQKKGAAIWSWNGGGWDRQWVGTLFGTHPLYGRATLTKSTPDASIIVGYNAFDPGNTAAIMWNETDGLVDLDQWLLFNGVSVPPDLDLLSLTGISDDGTILCGSARQMVAPYDYLFFRIVKTSPTSAPAVARNANLGPAFPNPFNPSTTIPLSLERSASVNLEVFDMRGRKIRTLHAGELGAGRHEFAWSGTDDRGASVASGVYHVSLRSAGTVAQTVRVVLVK